MKYKLPLFLSVICITSSFLVKSSQADWVIPAHSNVVIDTDTGETRPLPPPRPYDPKLKTPIIKREPPSSNNGEKSHSFGQISDGGGGALGTIDSDGTIRDTFGSMVGRVHDGTISDSRGLTEGMIDSRGRITKDGTVIGQLHGGEVSDISGHFIGFVHSDGTITDDSGTHVGSVPAGDTEAGAVFLLRRDCRIKQTFCHI